MSSYNFNNEIFNQELAVLKTAMDNLKNLKYKENELIEAYRNLALNYEKLLKFANKSVKISDSQGSELRRREFEIRNILDNSNQGFLTFGRNMIVNKEYSSECVRIFGRKISNVNIFELLKSDNINQNVLYQRVFEEIFDTQDIERKFNLLMELPSLLKINNVYVNISYKLINKDDIRDEELIMLIITDVTEKKKSEEQILFLSYHDKLTSLFNRAYINSIISQLQTEACMPLSIIVGDMNGLKLTNDVFGHAYGDELLVNASKILLSSCRSTDIISRWGGDEFLVLLPNTSEQEVNRVISKIESTCSNFDPSPIEVSISLGSATIRDHNTSILELFSMAENKMYNNKIIEGKKIRRKIILNIEKALIEKCFEDDGHTARVTSMAMNFAKALNIKESSNEMADLSLLAYLHDVGKISIPSEVLGKKQPLSEIEREIIKSYTEIGYRIALSIDEPNLAQGIHALRERWDGKGYPNGLKEDKIPLISRIVSIIDAYDAMTHHRPYREAMGQSEALEELINCSGTQFDPQLVELFIKEKLYLN
ncbi:cyclic di-GMP phosphodiesterase response regulator RpfG [Clostridium homopropionicum DSM 5847]|uniref:Cyclic di-GMP phosphodiesterase response regulator RpfG n=1 Tax=Clostridium homopropionicum DSM 5847 TaxID=1121318 RepID=A0A0L6Z9V2_9CLOT|nr:HD domain-containing phosphohydrolase [Clostridium homopropionicum]KOA19749.1 cyclic di-GMP phosphodiesterase response regulator RpfG [Clostridium homopropionicum DSM 5847]SFF78349.1 diguanylate cyclase (GGDEF) domain-containing protein [Clostridium homopropionicum]